MHVTTLRKYNQYKKNKLHSDNRGNRSLRIYQPKL